MLSAYLQALTHKGKMQLDIKGEKVVDVVAFIPSFASILIQYHPDFVANVAGFSTVSAMYNQYRPRTIIRDLEDKFFTILSNIDKAYVTKEGRFLTRVEKKWNNFYSHKIPTDAFGHIGGVMKNFVQQTRSYVIDFTNVFDWKDGQFGKSNSCWWGTYADSIPTFQVGGGYAIRFYEDVDDQVGIGRCWILPKYGSLIFFNCYGIEISDVKTIMDKLLRQDLDIDFEFKMIDLVNSKNSNVPYLNGGSGFLYTTSDNRKLLVKSKEVININLPIIVMENCINCGKSIRDMFNDYYKLNGDTLCASCLEHQTTKCDYCNKFFLKSVCLHVQDSNKTACQKCVKKLHSCKRCGTLQESEMINEMHICNTCYNYVSDIYNNSLLNAKIVSDASDVINTFSRTYRLDWTDHNANYRTEGTDR